MEDLSVVKKLKISSKIHDYSVSFVNSHFNSLSEDLKKDSALVIDKKVYELYQKSLSPLLEDKIVIQIEAVETNKNLECVQNIVEILSERGFKRNQTLIGIGGGIIQDLTCFTASILFRGIDWEFYPTTLLAQCDSCIGSKSSINLGAYKNQVGTFYPPKKITIDCDFIATLNPREILSGMGEAIKVHYLDEKQRYQQIFNNYHAAFEDRTVLEQVIYDSLVIKKRVIEIDEYDLDYRNIMNYGHTFGHALESVTNYMMPHGVAVSWGIGLANYVSFRQGLLSQEIMELMETLVLDNSKDIPIQFDDIEMLWSALRRDKKNIDNNINFILTKGFGKMFKNRLPLDNKIKGYIVEYLKKHHLYKMEGYSDAKD
jgi:3-dehydroquinate synthase